MGAPGVQTQAAWEPEYEIVKQFGGIDDIPPLTEIMDVDLVADLYDGDTLIWPGDK